ncbi:Hypothetical predicted protein [Paramuricea clavata]|uniref:Uncharacterized protein n=1 Tax=Paramuricea clavata TaxID=317549 RepID=A0A6S7GQR5_PARCT|nr:Hypothetical predicted protein [Paramuricea clavata]
MSSFGKEQSMFTLKSYNHSLLLQIEDNGILAATADPFESLGRPNVYFYVETAADLELDRLQYQFKPYSQSDKYIAVINGEIALKTKSECTESERSFYIHHENGDYMSFFVYTAGTTYYLFCEYNGLLGASRTKPERAAWFHMLPKDQETVLFESKELLFATNSFIDIMTEITLVEE